MADSGYSFDKRDLFKEKSLFDVYRISRLSPANGSNVFVATVAFFVSATYSIISFSHPADVLTLLRQITGDAIAFAASILGFLIAGFTIFVTSRPSIFYIMAKNEYESTGVSYLKYNLSVFLLVFIHYLLFSISCLAIRVFFATNGPASAILLSIPVSPDTIKIIKSSGICITFPIFTAWLFYILMLLKSFIFNIYHIVLTGIALTIDDDGNEIK